MTPSNTELREALEEIMAGFDSVDNEASGNLDYAVDEQLKLFQAREQQLLTELLGEAEPFQQDLDYSSPQAHEASKKSIEAVPVSVIERLQNKTNDGGNYGASE